MPIEIKELHIRINVDGSRGDTPSRMSAQDDKQQLIAECVERIMELITDKKER